MKLKVIYSKEMVAYTKTMSPSAEKPAQVFADWTQRGIPMEVITPIPVTIEELSQSHDPRLVTQILAGKKANGFGTNDKSVRDSLPYTVGAMVTGTLEALRTGHPVAALCSGFHHALYGRAGDFCTFNGLIVAAFEARKNRGGQFGAKRVGILDLDMHYGNGTHQIITKLGLDWIEHYTAGKHYTKPSQRAAFFEELPEIMKRFIGCDVLLVQLGADPYIHDPLGGWLTMPELRLRDRRVFQYAYVMNIPLCFNLAGGYARDENGGIGPVLDIHRASA